MITAHLPSGYVLSKLADWRGPVMAAALAGAVFPDVDLIWFYLIDDRAFHHHRYWVHAPAFAVGVGSALIGVAKLALPRLAPPACAFAAAWWLHILLDAPMGEVTWLWPMSTTLYAPITVPATQSHWVLSFVLHWSFLLELSIWLAAASLWLGRRRHAR